MKTKIKKICLMICALAGIILTTSIAFASINKQITYQGKLTRPSDGQPVTDSSYNLVIKIYDASSGGTCLWTARGSCGTPTAKSVTTSGGIFTTNLGESGDNALNLDFSSDTYYLGITVGSDSEMTPRRRLTATPQSFNSNNVIGDGFINLTSVPTGSGICQGMLCLNPSSANTTDTLLGIQSGSNPIFKVENDGKVGIGTNTPNKSLHIKTATGTNAEIDIQSGSNNYWAFYQDDTTGDLRCWNNSITGEKNALTLKNDGKVGVGTVSPTDVLDVYGAVRVTNNVSFDAAKGGRIYKGAVTGLTLQGVTGSSYDLGLYTPAGTGLIEVPTGTSNILLNRGGGNVGIGGVTNPGVKLDIAQNTALRVGSAYLSSGAAGYTMLANHEWYNGTTWTSDGSAGSLYEQIDQTHYWYTYNAADVHTLLMTLDSSGNLTANSFIYSSDQRLKKDIQPLANDALEKINQIQPVSFKWKDSGQPEIGFIAQNVEEVYPDLVTTDPGTGMKGLKYGNMTAVLMEAIKEQQQQIDELKQEVKALKNQ